MELPIAAEVKVLSTSLDSIKITLSNKQLKVAQVNMPIYFKLEYVGNVKAILEDIDIDKKIVTINMFRVNKHTPLNRELYRVQAQEGIKAYISDNNREYDVKIVDMSIDYVAIEIDRKRNFDINSLVYLDMLLPISDTLYPCVINATITRIDKVYGAYKMILLCHADTDSKEGLGKYIANRQMEIIHSFQIWKS